MERTLERLIAWMHIDSTSGQEAATLRALETDLTGRGFEVVRQEVDGPERWNIVATRTASPDVLLCTHVDTVPPFIPPRREGGTIWGRGACDTKGILAAMMAAWDQLAVDAPALADRVGFLLVVGEEVDHCGAAQAARLGLRPKRIILGEPTEAMMAVGQKGILKVRMKACGHAGHSAYPEGKPSANHRLVEGLGALLAGTWPDDDALGATTVNIGELRGGVAANVIADAAEAILLYRTVSDETVLFGLVEQVAEAHAVEVENVISSPAQRFDAPEGFETCVVRFNTDAAWLTALGPVWLVGPGDIKLAHSEHERITVAELEAGVAIYGQLIRLALGAGE